jgi:PAS domain S-box-containing protein
MKNSDKELKELQLKYFSLKAAFDEDAIRQHQAKQKLVIANEELAFQNNEKEKRAAELVIANKELAFQNNEKEKRAAELVIANKELAFQNNEKEKRAAELVIANKELAFQNKEKQKRSEEKAERNEHILQLFIKNAPASIAVFDREMKYISASHRYLNDYDLGKEKVIGRSHYEIFPEIPERWKEIYERCLAGATEKSEEDTFVCADGKLEWFRWEIRPWYEQQEKIGGIILFSEVITERKQAEEKLKENYALLHIAGDIAKLGGWNVNLVENRSYWSDEVAAIHEMPAGYAPLVEEGISFYAPEWHDKITEVFTNCVQKGVSYDEDMEILTASGKRVWVRTIGEAVRDNKGNIVKVQGAFQDITERIQIEKKLQQSEEKYRFMFTNNPEPMWIYDLETLAFLEINDAAINHYGYSRAEFLSMTLKDIRPKEDLDALFKNLKQLTKAHTFSGEWRHLKKNGEIITIEITSHFITFNNRKARHVMVNDITERKQAEDDLKKSEQKFKNAVMNAPFPIMIHSENGEVLLINDTWQDKTGYSHQEIPTIEKWTELAHGEKVSIVKEEINRLFELDKRLDEGEDEITTKNGEKIIWAFSSAPIGKNSENQRLVMSMAIDITKRKIAEKALLKSKQEYQSFFEDDLTGDYISTVEGKLLNCNPAYLKILGFSSKEEALNYDMHKVYVNEGNRNELIQKLKENKTITTFEGDIKRVDGTIINVVANIIGGFDSKGNLKTFKGYIFDQTERKKAIDELSKLSVAVEQSPATVLMTDIKGNIEYVNKKFTNVTGYSQKEVIGKNPRIFNSGHQSKEVYEQLWQNITSGKEWIGELLNKKKDGSLYWEQASISPIKNNKGKITHFLGVKEDISEKKRAEKVQNIILNISNASQTEIGLKDLMEVIQKELGRIVDTKNFFIAFYNKVNESFHIPYYKDLGGDDVVDFPASESISGVVIKKGKSLLLNESEMIKLEFEKTGMIGPNSKSWLGVPLKIKGKITGVFVVQSYEDENAYSENDKEILEIISQQISISIERKRHEEELLKALEKAEESHRLKSAFIANMSHEIRTPMNGIFGFTGLLKSADLNSDKQQKYIKIIEKSGARLLTTIDDIMNISKIESGLMKIYLSEININNEIEELYEFFKLETENKGLQLLIVNAIPEDESTIKTDKGKLHSILVNLIKNAIKFTKQGSVEFGCSKKGNQLKFYVKDTGIGIPKDRQFNVFDRFVQADIEDKAVFEGSGLGLAISKSYVEMLGGIIELESVEGIGSTFRFTIPCQAINKEIPVVKNESSTDFVVSEIPSLKILIVEDDMIAQLYFEELLSDVSKEILLAGNGYKALDLCRENLDIDLILMDIRMPGLNGYEVTKQIRQFNKEVIIIAQTAFAFSGDREKALDVGCNDYISKPINKDHLVSLIQKYFKK